MTHRRAVIIVGKLPQPGRTKTRLSPPLSLEQAAALYKAFLLDTTAIALSLHWERVTLVHPDEPGVCHALGTLVPPAVTLEPQRGAGLGAALAGAFESHIQAGFDHVVLIGSDTPTLPASFLDDAYAALDRCEVVLGPSRDGGYYLLAMRRLHPTLFEDISWSTELVRDQTLERAEASGLRVQLLPPWYDVDTPQDLADLRRDLLRLPTSIAPHTRGHLSTLQCDAALASSFGPASR
jgi:rSAM/selenodomain-associated transferase 1